MLTRNHTEILAGLHERDHANLYNHDLTKSFPKLRGKIMKINLKVVYIHILTRLLSDCLISVAGGWLCISGTAGVEIKPYLFYWQIHEDSLKKNQGLLLIFAGRKISYLDDGRVHCF